MNKQSSRPVLSPSTSLRINSVEGILPLRGVDQLEIISLQDNMVELLTTVDREEVQTVLQWVKREEGERLPPGRILVDGQWQPDPGCGTTGEWS